MTSINVSKILNKNHCKHVTAQKMNSLSIEDMSPTHQGGVIPRIHKDFESALANPRLSLQTKQALMKRSPPTSSQAALSPHLSDQDMVPAFSATITRTPLKLYES